MGNPYFSFKQFTVFHDKCGMKVGTDGTTLGAWASCPDSVAELQILDVGTGSGLIALMMAQRFPVAEITAIDLDADAVSQAMENVAASPFASRISVLECPLASFVATHEKAFDCIVCNPPFFVQSLECPDEKRTKARHTSSLSFEELAQSAFRLLKCHGTLSVIVPADGLSLMDGAAALAHLFARRRCLLKTSPKKPAKRVLLEYGREPAPCFEDKELVLSSEDYRLMTQDFYL